MKKKIIFFAVVIVVFVLLRSIASSMRTESNSTASTTVSSEIAEVKQQTESLPTIDETVICDDETAKIVVSGLTYNKTYDTYVVGINIENKTEKTIDYQIDWINVNGFTLGTVSFGEIYAGMNADADFGFEKDEVDLAEIQPITEIKFSVDLFDDATNEVLTVILAELKTSAYGQTTTEVSFEGTQVYNVDGISIYLKPSDNPTVKHPLLVYVINDSDRNIMLSYDGIAFNNTMAMEYMSGPYILAHTKRVTEMTLTYFGDEPQIDQINSVTLSVDILPYREDGGFSTGDMIETEPVTIQIG